jgi:tetratricopeptide (TPR) repeat protein
MHLLKKSTPITILLPFLIAAMALTGCGDSTTSRSPNSTKKASEAGYILRVDGESVVLGEASSPPLSLMAFVNRAQQLIQTHRSKEIGQLVETYPDLAEQSIFSTGVDSSIQRTVAIWLDGLAAPKQGGWSLFVADRAENPQHHTSWNEQRTAAWSAISRGAFAEVAEMRLLPPSNRPTPWPAAEANLLQATAMLAAAQHETAAARYEAAANQCIDWDNRVAGRAHLFAALAHDLGGNKGTAEKHRRLAEQLLHLPDINDPLTLNLLLKTETVTTTNATDLPLNSTTKLPQKSRPNLGGADNFSLRSVRARLGIVELRRGSPQAALLALKIAETETGNQPSSSTLRLNQAEALIALGQEEPAIATLVNLSHTEVRPQALAKLALLQLRRGQTDIALTVLHEAVTATTAEEHPDVYADVGLALLSLGESSEAMHLLGAAKAIYIGDGNIAAARRLLGNQLRYAQATGDLESAQQVRLELARIQAAY